MSEAAHHSRASARSGAAHPAARPRVEISHLPEQWQPTNHRPSLPVGVGFIAVGIAIVGLFTLISGALLLLNMFVGQAVPPELLLLHGVDAVGAAILIVLGAAFLSLATALWDQETWSLYTTVTVLFFLLAYLFFTGSITVLFLVTLLLFVYLLTVRHHFV